MLRLNDVARTDLAGGAYCAEFNIQPTGEPWIQAKSNVVNMVYPGHDEPLAAIRDCGITLPDNATNADTRYGKFCTIEFDRPEPGEFARLIDDLFIRFYKLDRDYQLATDIFDMR